MLGPNVNIQRSPLGGRNFESYSEDPYLAGKMGIGVRQWSAEPGRRHLRQTLRRQRAGGRSPARQFDRRRTCSAGNLFVAVRDDREGGTPLDRDGVVQPPERRLHDGERVSDPQGREGRVGIRRFVDVGLGCGAHDSRGCRPAVWIWRCRAHPATSARRSYAVRNWQVEQPVVDEAARRALRLIIARARWMVSGSPVNCAVRAIEPPRWPQPARRSRCSRTTATCCPWTRSKLRPLAIIGPNADVPLFEGGGSAAVIPSRILTPLSSLRGCVGPNVKLTYAQGADNDPLPPPADARLLSPTEERKEQGLRVSYFNNASFQGEPVQRRQKHTLTSSHSAGCTWTVSVRWEGFFWTPRAGTTVSAEPVGLGYALHRRSEGSRSQLGTLQPAQLDFGGPVRTATVDPGYRTRSPDQS